MTIVSISILSILMIIVLVLSLALFYFIKKSTYFSKKEKDFIIFTIDIFREYGEDLGIQSKDQHQKLCDELEKIKKKLNEY